MSEGSRQLQAGRENFPVDTGGQQISKTSYHMHMPMHIYTTTVLGISKMTIKMLF